MKICPGKPFPLGATYDGTGTNFSLFSGIADRVELCLFDDGGRESRFPMDEQIGGCRHIYLPTVKPGQRYGFRVHGPWEPAAGARCNPAKLLLDPYAKAIEGMVQWNDAVFPYVIGKDDLTPSDTDSAPFMPRCVVINPFYDWSDDPTPHTRLHETVIYEAHVKGCTKLHPDVPEEHRGTYAGLEDPAFLDHLKELGVTAVELLPVHQFIQEREVLDRGLRNYWGYNSIGFLAPHNEYSASGQRGEQVQEFKHMVHSLHREGIEVILDVVYNHTAEGNHLGPMLSFKGIDNAYYYRLMEDRRYYRDYTGTGNTLNMRNPHVLQLVMDSLRYWLLEMHVDGFRFDLAATLARGLHDVDRLSAFFDLIQQDPVIGQAKLIAEPWDLGEGGYQVGNFPPNWSEWNGRYRDAIRDFWRGARGVAGDFASRICGSADLYEGSARRPHASVNFVTAHDGFALHDLVSYDGKHNEANGEGNRDGTGDNRSWNCGAEGHTHDPAINALRARMKRNFLATLLLSQGIPMILGGDEIGRTKKGNNNAYCQDNALSWFDWSNPDHNLCQFAARLIGMRLKHPTFRRRKWLRDEPGGRAVAWFRPDGQLMTDRDWGEGNTKSLAMFLNGKAIAGLDDRGDPVTDEDFLLLFNAQEASQAFLLPDASGEGEWISVVNTALTEPPDEKEGERFRKGNPVTVTERSLMVLQHVDS